MEELLESLSYFFSAVMVDHVQELEREKMIRAVKWVSANEFYLAGHFPGEPILPGVLTLEGIIQSALILAAESPGRGKRSGTLAKVDRVRFKRAVIPGDRVEFLVSLTAKDGALWKFKGKARVGEETAAEADVVLKITQKELGFGL